MSAKKVIILAAAAAVATSSIGGVDNPPENLATGPSKPDDAPPPRLRTSEHKGIPHPSYRLWTGDDFDPFADFLRARPRKESTAPKTYWERVAEAALNYKRETERMEREYLRLARNSRHFAD
ncbi:hypothetical protein FOZ63_023015 [Perkinsus olseni]|uniref:Uncharacterized protein n=1 Tax=Perkinsus olseni TaxID=32597 RepID=A0A7J6Q315_PEROL|nr:hypothetical protein FOZ60_008623 [Perkinsus olseni]KAF4702693.1 hypothetical protein FOZ63_023015 [Perkinsus olseni]